MLPLKYTPSAIPLLEFVLAFPQERFQKQSMGYAEIILEGDLALEMQHFLRIGKSLTVEGLLWNRKYKNKKMDLVLETKVLGKKIKEIKV